MLKVERRRAIPNSLLLKRVDSYRRVLSLLSKRPAYLRYTCRQAFYAPFVNLNVLIGSPLNLPEFRSTR